MSAGAAVPRAAPQTAGEIEENGYYRGLTKRAARASRILLVVLVIGGVLLAGWVGRAYLLERRWSAAYAMVTRADSRSHVTNLMGGLGAVIECNSTPMWEGVRLTEADVTCASAVSYMPVPFFEGWTFEFDANDRVISKSYWTFD